MRALLLSSKRFYFHLIVLSFLSSIIHACGDPLPSLPLDASPPTEIDAQVVDEGSAGEEVADVGTLEQDAGPADSADAFCQECSDEASCPNGYTCFTNGSNNEQFCSKPCNSDDDCPSSYDCVGAETSLNTDEDVNENAQSYCVPTEGTCSPTLCRDEDGDGYGRGPDCAGLDCADDNPDIHEGVTDLCDNVDKMQTAMA